MHVRLTRSRFAAIFAAVLLLASCATPETSTPAPGDVTGSGAAEESNAEATAEATAPTELEEVGLISPIAASLVDVATYVALEEEIFQAHGLNVTHTTAAGGGPDMQALLAGEVDFSFAYPGATLSAVAQGEEVFAAMVTNSQTVGAVLLRADYAEELGITEDSPLEDRVDALNGAVIGVSTPGSFFAQTADFIIAEFGIEGAEILPLGGGATALAGLEQGQVDALIYSPPVLQTAVLDGYAIWLLRPAEGDIPALENFAQSTLNVRRDLAEERPDTVRRMAAALVEANQWVIDHTPQEVVDTVRDQGFAEMDEDVLLQSVEFMQGVVDPDGCMTEENFAVVEELLITAGAISGPVPFEDYASNEYLPSDC